MTFAEEMKERRLKRKLTLREVEMKTGIPNPMISQYERGSCCNPSFRNAILLSRLYRWPLKEMARSLVERK